VLSAANRAALAARGNAARIAAPVTINFHPDRRLDDGRSVGGGAARRGCLSQPVRDGDLERAAGRRPRALRGPEVNDRTTCVPVDDYIEAHVHGPVRLGEDVEALVLDPAYSGTQLAEALAATALPVEWHAGFVLAVEDIPVRSLGESRWQRFCAGGRARAYARTLGATLDAAVIGRAAVDGYTDELKDLWVMTVKLGRARTRVR
jgi:hypothetical protein